MLVPADDRNSRPALQADWSARGVWEGNRVALFDNRIVDANEPSYQRSLWYAIARKAAEAKREKHAQASEDLRSSFTPLFARRMPFSTGSTRLTRNALQAVSLPNGTSSTQSWWPGSGCRPQFAIIRTVDLRLRGTRRRLVGLTLQDGAGLGVGH